MANVATISINFGDTEIDKEYIDPNVNSPEIIMECIKAAQDGKPIYKIESGWRGYSIVRRDPKVNWHHSLTNYRNGEFTWCSDFACCKYFSLATATKHIKTLYERGE